MAFQPGPQLPDLSRLLPVLNNSGIQKTNQPLYQVIKSLLDYLSQSNALLATVTGSGGGASLAGQDFVTSKDDTASLPNSRTIVSDGTITINTGPNGKLVIGTAIPLGGDGGGDGGDDGPPGPQGPPGSPGVPGPAGTNAVSQLIAFDGVDGEDGFPLSPPGAQGFTGAQGVAGQPGKPGEDGIDGEEGPWYPLPGPQGPPATLTNFIQTIGPARSGTFQITGLAGLTTGKNVMLFQTNQPIPSKGNATDEFEMDAIELTGVVFSATTINVTFFASDDSVLIGDYAFAYQVAN